MGELLKLPTEPPSKVKENFSDSLSFFNNYMEYAGADRTEAPNIYHRWTAVSIIATSLGRQCYLPFGNSFIMPNHYIMLHGDPGARKGTAMGPGKKILKGAGFNRFGPDKCSKEKFLGIMRTLDDFSTLEDADIMELTLDEPSETYIFAEEFTDFIGPNNMEFVTMLTKLWDNLPEYEHPKLHGPSIKVHKPTVNILGANTLQGFALAFPAEALGNGFLSRLILVHGEKTGRRIAWPKPPDPLQQEFLINHLKDIRKLVVGEITVTPAAYSLADKIYQNEVPIDDHRFTSYITRRHTHLLKLSLVLMASELRTTLEEQDLLRANGLLLHTEKNMHKALGEFGQSKYSDVSSKIINMLNMATIPVDDAKLWKFVSNDLSGPKELADIIRNLTLAGKIQQVTLKGKKGHLPLHKASSEWDKGLYDESWLTNVERGITI